MGEEATSKFNINFVRECYLFGDEVQIAIVKKLLKAYYFLTPRSGSDVGGVKEDVFFMLACADFTSPDRMQVLGKILMGVDTPLAHKVVYVSAPAKLSREQLLFAQEIGARYVCSGATKNDDLKDYLKRVCVEYHQVGALAPVEEEIQAAYKVRNKASLIKLQDRLKVLPETEESLRLLVMLAQYLSDMKRVEAYLKRMLALNNQNLWAANTLGKLFLRNGRAAEGIEVLQKLSQFHELNSERLLTLGNAQVTAGRVREAETSFGKGDKLSGGKDARFKDGMAKVKLADGDVDGALGILGDKQFSSDLISFLNMRAILAIRGEKFDEGVHYYDHALKGAPTDKDVRAKLFFNKGLAHVRSGTLEKAQECFAESAKLGGKKFDRAKGPLETVKAVIKRGGSIKKDEAQAMLDDSPEWETLY